MLFNLFHDLNYYEKIPLTKHIPTNSFCYITDNKENGWSRKNPHSPHAACLFVVLGFLCKK